MTCLLAQRGNNIRGLFGTFKWTNAHPNSSFPGPTSAFLHNFIYQDNTNGTFHNTLNIKTGRVIMFPIHKD